MDFRSEISTVEEVDHIALFHCTTFFFKNIVPLMAFELFLTKCHKRYNIFEEEGGTMEEGNMIYFLLKRFQNSELKI